MTTTDHSWLDRAVSPVGAAASSALLFAARGFQGLGLEQHATLEAARAAGRALTAPTLWEQTALTAHPSLDLLFGAALRVLPTSNLLAVWSASVLTAIASTWLIARITSAAAGRTAGFFAGLLFALHPLVQAEAATLSPTLATLALLLAIWELGTSRSQRWWHMLGVWGLGALLLGAWLPMLAWALLLILNNQLERGAGESPRGVVPSTHTPLSLMLAPLLVPALATLHPRLLANPRQAWFEVFEAGWLAHTADISYGMQHWPGGRTDLLATLDWITAPISWTMLALAILGAFAGDASRTRLPALTSLLLVFIAWALPHHAFGAVHTDTLFIASASILSGIGAASIRQVITARWSNHVAPWLFAACALPLGVAAFTHGANGAQWTHARPGGAPLARGESPRQPHILPRRATSRLTGDTNFGQYAPIVEEYRAAGYAAPRHTSDHDAARLFTFPMFSPMTANRPTLIMEQDHERELVGPALAPSFIIVSPPARPR